MNASRITSMVIGVALAVLAGCNAERGCTDPQANNYNPEAKFDDGGCEYGIQFDEPTIPVVVVTPPADTFLPILDNYHKFEILVTNEGGISSITINVLHATDSLSHIQIFSQAYNMSKDSVQNIEAYWKPGNYPEYGDSIRFGEYKVQVLVNYSGFTHYHGFYLIDTVPPIVEIIEVKSTTVNEKINFSTMVAMVDPGGLDHLTLELWTVNGIGEKLVQVARSDFSYISQLKTSRTEQLNMVDLFVDRGEYFVLIVTATDMEGNVTSEKSVKVKAGG
ncbi:MAG: hypothetical protein R2813_07680 [Flavobacteriales bacterium]